MENLVEKLSNIESLLEKLTQPPKPSLAMMSPVHTHSLVIPPPTQRHKPTLSPTASSSQTHKPAESPVPASSASHPPPPPVKKCNRLPSSAIRRERLAPLATVIEANKDLMNSDSKMTTFALNLAREAIFGEDVMIKCTTHGFGDTPGLPLAELLQLKEEVRRHYPKYCKSPQDFELRWKACTEAISQGCKRLRAKNRKK